MQVARIGRAEEAGGARRDRTADLLRARQALSQLSYGPSYSKKDAVFFAVRSIVAPPHSLLCKVQGSGEMQEIGGSGKI